MIPQLQNAARAAFTRHPTEQVPQSHRKKWKLAKQLDQCNGVNEPHVEGTEIVIDSTFASCCGTVVAVLFFVAFFGQDIMVSNVFSTEPSSVNEQSLAIAKT